MKYVHRRSSFLLLFLLSLLLPIMAAQAQPTEDVDLRYRKSLTEDQIEQVSTALAKDATASSQSNARSFGRGWGSLVEDRHRSQAQFPGESEERAQSGCGRRIVSDLENNCSRRDGTGI
jgi:hypothetical protein